MVQQAHQVLRRLLHKADSGRVTRQMQRMTNKRNRQIDHYLHTASRRIIDFLVAEGVGTVIIGLNPLWKQKSNSASARTRTSSHPPQPLY